MSLTRRILLGAGALLPLLSTAQGQGKGKGHETDPGPQDRFAEAGAALARIAGDLGGRAGIAVLDTSGGPALLHDAEGAFPLCSTFKLLLAAAILARVEAGRERLDRRLAYGEADLDTYAPVTTRALRAGGPEAGAMSVEALCAAALVWSDNTAANLLLDALGGPAALTAYGRSLGDPVTRLDRTEPDLNSAVPGDPRDTTRPAAMAATVGKILLGPSLTEASRARLEGWMTASRTGTKRLRAGLPADWGVGDKTGSGAYGTANVVALLRPPARAPLVAAIYLTGSDTTSEARDAAHAAIGRVIAATYG
ncbi:class A beta-lactamase [Methylobacterium sp. Leaf465]|uniref:class A beta-lactamase n=1 Tax=Methylobacterium sp. Leaf465 TaxID=1736385 RepID=UPI0006F4D2D7|nr:class A beta-lactamase [Methylobacterium sp. Leaf465]KQT73570.1 class A beta-lactamase [Methylobacterium sp. Leaf465]